MGAGRREQGGENWAGVIAESGALDRGRNVHTHWHPGGIPYLRLILNQNS